MTVTYNPQVATASNSAFLRLLLRYEYICMFITFFQVEYVLYLYNNALQMQFYNNALYLYNKLNESLILNILCSKQSS